MGMSGESLIEGAAKNTGESGSGADRIDSIVGQIAALLRDLGCHALQDKMLRMVDGEDVFEILYFLSDKMSKISEKFEDPTESSCVPIMSLAIAISSLFEEVGTISSSDKDEARRAAYLGIIDLFSASMEISNVMFLHGSLGDEHDKA